MEKKPTNNNVNKTKSDLINKYERPYIKKNSSNLTELYKKQTDKNYKDGDRN